MLSVLNASKRGKVAMARGHWDAAERSFDEAIRLLERFGEPRDADERLTIATSYAEKAELVVARGRPDLALPLFNRAIDLLSQHETDYERGEVALLLAGRGEAARKAGDAQRAGADLDRALALQKVLVSKDLGNAYARWILGRIHVELAAVRVTQGATKLAAEQYHAAQEIGRALHAGEPKNKLYALMLGQSLQGAEDLARAQGDLDQAGRLHVERCDLINDFVARDSEDTRFQQLGCR